MTARLQPIGSLAGSRHLQLAIGLPLRNQAALTNLLREIYDPASPNYHHYLTPEQFTEQFGPSRQDYQAVIAFAKANGFKVTATYPNRLLVDVNGSVSDIERAMHVKMQEYQHPTENRRFYAPDTEPSLDLAVPILSISGLNNYSLPRPRFIARPLANVQTAGPNAGSGPGGTYMGNDFRTAYVPDTTLTGTGQTVGLLQFDGYTASDITYYEDQAGLPHVPLTNVLIDGATGNPSGSGGEVEVSLDIEMAISMAPGLSQVIVYMAPNPSPFVDILNRMASDNLARQLSCSWYVPNGAAEPSADAIFQEMAAQGQSFFNASGDGDAYIGLIDFPGDTPYITQVGGTTLTTSGAGGAWTSETVWNRDNGTGSGGGISTQYPIPDWQTNIDMTANQGSTTMRNTPDVALTAENVYVRADGADYDVGGTSCAAPLWAGFMALVNQQAAAAGGSAVGFVNPAIDSIGTSTNYTNCFHDITTGDNTSPSSPSKFYAVPGYDLCTGWGTPRGQKLIDALANPEPLRITPATGFASLGGVGGPFTVTTEDFSLTNAGTNVLTWTLSNTSLWLNVSATTGTLLPGGPATNVTVNLNSVASNLAVGTYTATLSFTNLHDNVGQDRQFTLAVLSPPAITQQPTNQGVLDGATAAFTAGVSGGLPLYYQWQYNSNNLTDGGNISGSTTTNLTVQNASLANSGYYRIIATNAAGVAVSSNAVLSITPSKPMITRQPADETVAVNSTARFSVSAIGTKPFSYQWNFNTTNIPGATNVSLILTNVQFSQAGSYAVMITNSQGSNLSSNANLTVVPCDPTPSGLAAWWPAEDNAYDIIGGNNGVPVGNLTYTNGEVGQAFVFDGSTSYIPLPASASLNIGTGSGITIECWIQPASANTQGPMTEWDSSSTDGLQFWVQPGLLLFANLKDTSGADHVMATAAGVLDTNHLQHVALTYDKSSGTAVIYLNGTPLLSTNFGSFTPQTTYPLNIGRRLGQIVGLGETYGGLLDELSLYNRALSSNEIAGIYQAGSAGKCFTPAPPTITNQPASLTVTVGQTASFSVGAGGSPPLSYQWRFGTTNIAEATNAMLVLHNVQPTNAGTYAVVVSNLAGSILSSNATLTVNSAPTNCDPAPSGLVSWWPAEGNANDIIGTNNGTPVGNLAYTNGEVGLAFVFDGSTSYIPLPASSSLNIGTGSGITIECWIKPASANTEGPMTEWDSSSTDGLQFWVQPGLWLFANIKDTLGNSHVMATPNGLLNTNNFQHVALTYDKSSGVAVIYLNGTPVLSTNFGSFTPQTTYPTYALNIGRRTGQSVGLNQTYSGEIDELSLYNRALSSNEVAAIYQAGSAGKCFTPMPPAIIIQPTNQTVAVGQTATFSVNATGTQPLSYQWNFNGTNIIDATNAMLSLTDVQLDQAGTYAVVVSNLVSSVLSSNASLTVLSPPVITQQPSNQIVYVGGTASFSVYAVGTQPLYYQWNFNQTNIANATNMTLILTNVQLYQAGDYSVQVTNVVNSILSANAVLTVNLPPALGATPSGGYLYMFWPVNAQGFVLESTPSLSPPVWVVVPNPPIQIGDEYLQPIPMTGTNQFYRLQLTNP